MLRVEPGELDADEFERLVASAGRAADAGDHARTVDALTRALALWRGPAWADMLELPLASAEAHRLEELRLGALESRIEAELASGARGGARPRARAARVRASAARAAARRV